MLSLPKQIEPLCNTRPTRAIGMLSGGLDSTLAIQMMREQGIDVLALNFVSPFCTCSPRRAAGCHRATEVARSLGVEIRILSKGIEYLKIVERPRFGTGRGINPCIDCRIYILQKAAALMDEVGASFVVTGEVLGQRPMSQHRQALEIIERESGLTGRILRPLSAHLLEPTQPELDGRVDRAKLLSIHGRSRKEQLAFAQEHGVEVFGCPAGGCLLTDPLIAKRLRDVFDRCPGWDLVEARLTTAGRHFRLRDGLKAIVGRDEPENDRLRRMAPESSWMELGGDFKGPVMILRGEVEEGDRPVLGRLLRHFARKVTAAAVPVLLWRGDQSTGWTATHVATLAEIEGWSL